MSAPESDRRSGKPDTEPCSRRSSPLYRRLVSKRPAIPEFIDENIAVNCCDLLITLGERDQGINIAVNKAAQPEAPYLVLNTEKLTDKYDVRADGDKVENSLSCCNGVALPCRAGRLVFGFHHAKHVSRVCTSPFSLPSPSPLPPPLPPPPPPFLPLRPGRSDRRGLRTTKWHW